MKAKQVHIIGAGLAGSQAAWHLAQNGIQVHLHEMRPTTMTDAHKTSDFAELVCSNSFRSDDAQTNAVGVLHAEMRMLGSLIMNTADAHQVPAGGALAVDRDAFSGAITQAINNQPNIIIHNEEIKAIPDDWAHVIIATGPLTSSALAQDIAKRTGADALAFFDAIAPIIYHESINMDVAWAQSRYDKSGPGGTGADYINCPMDRIQYDKFVSQLIEGEKISFKEWEANTPYFAGCQPIEIMAQSGPQTLRFGPMKPVGLFDPKMQKRPYAVVQLRQDNKLGTLFNMVGFQTKLKHAEQVRIFKTIPGLEDAEFARLGGMHRNSYINSPTLLDETLALKSDPRIHFAGQITGCEGYVESAAMGHMAAIFLTAKLNGQKPNIPPASTAHGALLNHITGGHIVTIDEGTKSYQPMNINFGLFPPLSEIEENGITAPRKERGRERKKLLAAKALADMAAYAQLSL